MTNGIILCNYFRSKSLIHFTALSTIFREPLIGQNPQRLQKNRSVSSNCYQHLPHAKKHDLVHHSLKTSQTRIQRNAVFMYSRVVDEQLPAKHSERRSLRFYMLHQNTVSNPSEPGAMTKDG